MEYKLQNIIFPTQLKLEEVHNLYYRNYRPVLDRENRIVTMMDNSILDFCTYLNGCSYAKWKKYTGVKALKLSLDIQGKFEVVIVGYHMELNSVMKKEFSRRKFDFAKRQIAQIEIPDTEETLAGFEIVSHKDTVFYGGEYVGVFEDGKKINPVELSLATTTCRKEEFILGNLELLKKEIYQSGDEMKEHFYVHVIDNARTLDAAALTGGKITVHPNKNVGGSGGFARGMIESLRQTPQATHILLMDDDVLVLPESIKRTYTLLQLLNDEWKDSFVEGAMLRYENMVWQHEDIGTILDNSQCSPYKPPFNQEDIQSNVHNEDFFDFQVKKYGAWWYCCIPANVIKENGLPLPIFVRSDDIEYGLRCKKNIITMNGICIWHMGFVGKYNIAMGVYQSNRNMMVARAVGTLDREYNVAGQIKNVFYQNIYRFYYNAAEVAVRALEDYLKGPEFLEHDLGEKILKENFALNEKMLPFENFPDVQWERTKSLLDNPGRSFMKKVWYRLTANGHRFWPLFLLRKSPAQIVFYSYQPAKCQCRKQLLSVNPFEKTACLRKIDKKRYRRLKRRWNKVWYKFLRTDKKVCRRYREAFPYLTSEEFWKKYLGI